MKVVAEVRGPVEEPYLRVHQEHVLGMLLRPGSMEVGSRRSEIRRLTFRAGDMGLCTPASEQWIGSADMEHVTVAISNAALKATQDGESGEVELRPLWKLVDGRLKALVTAVNAERILGFPSGQLFLDSVEQAIAVALVNGYGVRRPGLRTYRGGLTPARLRRVREFVQANIDADLTLQDMAESVNFSVAHFSQMFRQSTGQNPHQFVLLHRVERAKGMLRADEARVLDVAVACGFKTQQHFARVFRRISGTSPTEYRQELLGRSDRLDQ